MKNFHLPLPEQTYRQLREEAARSGVAATVLAREAIGAWLEERRKRELHQAIAEYAAEMAGTPMDLDPDLEEASLEHLADLEKTSS